MLQQTETTRAWGALPHAPGTYAVPSTCAHQCRMFSKLDSNDSVASGPVLKFAPRKTIFSKGDPAHHSYRVIEGAVRLSRILMDGHRQVLDLLLPGETFGIEATAEYSATAEAIGEVVLLRCPRACIAHQLATRSGAASQMSTMLSNGVSSAQDHVAMLTHQGATQRVALFLTYFHEKQQRRTIELPVGRQDMADYLGLTIETTCRSLTELKNKGVISIFGRRGIDVRKPDALEAIGDGDED